MSDKTYYILNILIKDLFSLSSGHNSIVHHFIVKQPLMISDASVSLI